MVADKSQKQTKKKDVGPGKYEKYVESYKRFCIPIAPRTTIGRAKYFSHAVRIAKEKSFVPSAAKYEPVNLDNVWKGKSFY